MTTEEIYNEIAAEKDNMTSLAALTPDNDNAANLLAEVNSKSKVALWRLFAWLIAFAHYLQWTRFMLFKSEVQAIADAAQPPTAAWYLARVKEFQYGDIYQVINGVPKYATIDPAKQIIKRAAIVKVGGSALVKVASEDGDGNATQLTELQMQAFATYVDEFAIPGSDLQLVSLNKDLLKLFLTVNYKGIYSPVDITTNVDSAVRSYLKNLDFEKGLLKTNDLITAIRAVEGVDDVLITTIEAKKNTGTYAPVVGNYPTSSGYIDIDPAYLIEDNIILSAVI